MFSSSGLLSYSFNKFHSLRLIIDPEISRYYRCLMPKWVKSNRQYYSPHISVVRNVICPKFEYWDKYEDYNIEFIYKNIVFTDGTYLWLNCFSQRLEEIRQELGLPLHDKDLLCPSGFKHCFHLTIGNFKAIA